MEGKSRKQWGNPANGIRYPPTEEMLRHPNTTAVTSKKPRMSRRFDAATFHKTAWKSASERLY
jgi:hypothetical protein